MLQLKMELFNHHTTSQYSNFNGIEGCKHTNEALAHNSGNAAGGAGMHIWQGGPPWSITYLFLPCGAHAGHRVWECGPSLHFERHLPNAAQHG